MHIGEEQGEEQKTPLRVITPDEVEVEEEPIPVELPVSPAEAPIPAPDWFTPKRVKVGGGV